MREYIGTSRYFSSLEHYGLILNISDGRRSELGDSISEVVRSIVISWLSEKGIITTIASTKMNDKRDNNLEDQ